MFLRNTYQSPCQYGIKKISLYIETSFPNRYPEVVFDFFLNDHKWTVCWTVDIFWKDLFMVINSFRLTWEEANGVFNNPNSNQEFYKALRKISPIHSHPVDEKIVELLNELCKNGLPEPEEIPRGLDGHDYHIRIDGFSSEYWCWCSLPEEWKNIKPIINQCVAYAQLNPARYGILW